MAETPEKTAHTSVRIYRRILLIALATHLPVLFNDGIYWDSWMPELAAERGDLDLTVQPFHVTGVPLVGYFYYAIGQLPCSVFAYKLLAFLSTCLIALATYTIARRARFLSDTECQLVAIATLVWAAFRVHAVDVLAPYMFATALMFVVYALCVCRPLTWRLRAISLALLTVAMLLYGALYVFHYGLLAVWLAIGRRERSNTIQWLMARVDFVLLPIVLTVAMKAFFPPAETMANNYNVKLDAALLATHAGNFLFHGIYLPIRDNLNPVSFVAYIVLLAGVAIVGRKRIAGWQTQIANYPMRSWREIGQLAGSAVVLFGFGALAFVLVGKSPDGTFWWSRQAMLISCGVGLGFVAITWTLRRVTRKPVVLWMWLALVGWIAVGNWVQQQQTYVMLQARWISYRSLVHNLKESRAFDDLTFLHVDEQAFLAAGYQDHTSYTWSVMFSHFGWGNKDKAVVGPLPYEFYCDELKRKTLDSRSYAMTNVTLDGKHGRMVIKHGPNAPFGQSNPHVVQVKLVAQYYLRRFFQSADMPAFLSGVTTLERHPIAGDVPRCSTAP